MNHSRYLPVDRYRDSFHAAEAKWEEAEADCLNVTIQNNQGALERAAAASEKVTGSGS